jgi:hypothetical protein
VADWVIAAVMVATGTRRELAAPLLLVAGMTLLLLHRHVLADVIGSVQGARRSGVDPWAALETAVASRAGTRKARLLLREPRLAWSVLLLLRRRYDGAPASAFSAHRDALPTWLVLAVLALVELALTPLLPLPATLSALLLLLGGWGLVVAVGLIAALVVHPHLVTESALRVRVGFWDEVRVPVTHIRAVQLALQTNPRGYTISGSTASLTPTGVTNLALLIDPPIVLRSRTITRLQIWADDAHALRLTLDARP